MAIQSKNKQFEVTPVISFNQDTETRQVKFEGEDVGTILIDRKSKRQTFRTKALTIDGLHNIAQWVDNEKLANRIKVNQVREKPSPMFHLYLKTPNCEQDKRIFALAELVYRTEQVENLPF